MGNDEYEGIGRGRKILRSTVQERCESLYSGAVHIRFLKHDHRGMPHMRLGKPSAIGPDLLRVMRCGKTENALEQCEGDEGIQSSLQAIAAGQLGRSSRAAAPKTRESCTRKRRSLLSRKPDLLLHCGLDGTPCVPCVLAAQSSALSYGVNCTYGQAMFGNALAGVTARGCRRKSSVRGGRKRNRSSPSNHDPHINPIHALGRVQQWFGS